MSTAGWPAGCLGVPRAAPTPTTRRRTLWWMGDSQTCHFYYSAECFLREFALRMNRT